MQTIQTNSQTTWNSQTTLDEVRDPRHLMTRPTWLNGGGGSHFEFWTAATIIKIFASSNSKIYIARVIFTWWIAPIFIRPVRTIVHTVTQLCIHNAISVIETGEVSVRRACIGQVEGFAVQLVIIGGAVVVSIAEFRPRHAGSVPALEFVARTRARICKQTNNLKLRLIEGLKVKANSGTFWFKISEF